MITRRRIIAQGLAMALVTRPTWAANVLHSDEVTLRWDRIGTFLTLEMAAPAYGWFGLGLNVPGQGGQSWIAASRDAGAWHTVTMEDRPGGRVRVDPARIEPLREVSVTTGQGRGALSILMDLHPWRTVTTPQEVVLAWSRTPTPTMRPAWQRSVFARF